MSVPVPEPLTENVAGEPAQVVTDTGLVTTGGVLTVTTNGLEGTLGHPLPVTVTVYDPAVVTVIERVVAPLLHE